MAARNVTRRTPRWGHRTDPGAYFLVALILGALALGIVVAVNVCAMVWR